ncbi:MAG: protein-glutamate O-methyltransferase CheR [Lachnospiraceae bacterium]|nr:protein-glutamate O-methyltransferase CheR [Lachnospiraceae bacterium]
MDYELFKKEVYKLTKIDLSSYKEKQMKRRIDALIAKNKFDGYASYVKGLQSSSELFEGFVNYLTINVSEFFRNPEQWQVLEDNILADLFQRQGKKLKIWSAACSTGDEPYSLVMLLSKHMPLSDIKIYATDIDSQILEKAKAGLYNEKSLKGVPKEFLDKYFTPVGKSNYQISDSIKKCVEFKKHNLLLDPYPKDMDLIVCRNVLIYFTDEAKYDVYKKFNEALKKDAYLFIGSTEQIIQYRELNFVSKKTFFYQKV